MINLLIYQSTSERYYGFVSFNYDLYEVERREMIKRGDKILWERKDVTLEQVECFKKRKDDLLKRLNEGQRVDLKKELSNIFE